ncbi:TPA: hypothetical protein HA273_05540 [Candidatus Bathyarchaeota archaeon]|nr:hypothetical protein [Candidatus Bathyarchaeota archaeon]HIJ08592.1 hypothetical protein [Candidatus Bathyarchaeota archaeon]
MRTFSFFTLCLEVLRRTGISLFVTYWFVWVTLLIASLIILVAWNRKIDPHKILTLLVGLNIILDILAIAIWAIFPGTQWSIYRLGFSIVGTEAALAAVLFTLTLFGIFKRRKWGPFLAIAITVAQRVFGTYVFFPSPAIVVTLIWSSLIVYFAANDLNNSKLLPVIVPS